MSYKITIEDITDIVCDYFNMPVDYIRSKTRKREVVQARQIAMFFSKSLTKLSLTSIGSQIGQKDHATVLHACKTVNNLIDTDKQFRNEINEINKRIGNFINNKNKFVANSKCEKNILVGRVICTNVSNNTIFVDTLIHKETSVEAINRLRGIAKLRGYNLLFEYQNIYKELNEDNFKISLMQICNQIANDTTLSEIFINSEYYKFIEKINREYGFVK